MSQSGKASDPAVFQCSVEAKLASTKIRYLEAKKKVGGMSSFFLSLTVKYEGKERGKLKKKILNMKEPEPEDLKISQLSIL